jgi:hypothetical protein
MSSKVENLRIAIQLIDDKMNKLRHRREELTAQLSKAQTKSNQTSSAQRTPMKSEPKAPLIQGADATGAAARETTTSPTPTAGKGKVGESGFLLSEELVIQFFDKRIKDGIIEYDKAVEPLPLAYYNRLKEDGVNLESLRSLWNVALAKNG